MGYIKYMREAWKKPKQSSSELYKQRLYDWRRAPVTERLEKPTRIDRARSIGYRAKEGVIVARQRVKRGGKMRPFITGGRRSKHTGRKLTLRKNYKRLAEERCAKKFKNCEVLGSYFVIKDGQHSWYEVVMIDVNHPAVLKDKEYARLAIKTDRVGRGLTSAGRKARGLRRKGKGAEKIRPSRGANKRLH